jgi:Reverse transcriptase (RNA-dependent DNA polymerase)
VSNRHHSSQGATLSPTLYNIFTSDVPSSEFYETATFADDTAIFATGKTPLLVQDQLQDHLNEISDNCMNFFVTYKLYTENKKYVF